MQPRHHKLALILGVLLSMPLMAVAQGQGFVNLDFESANLSGYSPGLVPSVDAIPGWTALTDGSPESYVAYDAPGPVEIVGATSVQGNYYVQLTGRRGVDVAIGQTGTVPDSALSLVFSGFVNLGTVSFDGRDLPLVVLGQTSQFNVYGADISDFAGHSGQLLFSATGTAFATIDNIQFSPTAIPEPTAGAVLSLGLCAWCLWRRRR